MFRNLGVHVINNPAGTWSFVGTLPASLGDEVPATTADVMAGRAYRNQAGEIVSIKFPVFNSREAAIEYASEHGIDVRS